MKLLWEGEGEVLEGLAEGCGIVIEIGSLEGGSTLHLAQGAGLVIAIDPFIAPDPDQEKTNILTGKDMIPFREQFVRNIRHRNIAWMNCTSLEAWHSLSLVGLQADGLFIDGSHTRSALEVDCQYLGLVKPGGWAAFHDYANPNHVEVKQVVDRILDGMELKREVLHSMLVVRK